jgi:hypothetical protein
LTGKAIPGCERELEALGDFRFNEDGCAFITLVGVLLVDGGVVLLRVVAALHDARHELS